MAAGSTPQAVAQAILFSAESNADIIQDLFHDFLHRTADPSGLATFSSALQRGATQDVLIAAIMGSEEYFAQAQRDSA